VANERHQCRTSKTPDILIQEAAFNGDITAIKQHIAAGTDVNAKGENGETPLILAAATGHKKIVELLIANGADVNAADDWAHPPLHIAAGYGHTEIVELLITASADVNATVASGRHKGMTPLDQAIDPDNPNASARMADLLRKHGAKTGEELKDEGK